MFLNLLNYYFLNTCRQSSINHDLGLNAHDEERNAAMPRATSTEAIPFYETIDDTMFQGEVSLSTESKLKVHLKHVDVNTASSEIPTDENIAYETAATNIRTVGNVCYETGTTHTY